MSIYDDEQIQADMATMQGERPPAPRGTFTPPDQRSPRVYREDPWWLTMPHNQTLLAGFLVLTLFVAAQLVQWWWTVVYQMGAWFLAIAREEYRRGH